MWGAIVTKNDRVVIQLIENVSDVEIGGHIDLIADVECDRWMLGNNIGLSADVECANL